MPDRLDAINGVSDALLEALIDEHERHVLPRLERLWAYYRNALEPVGGEGRWYRLPQERGLPPRVTRPGRDLLIDDRASRREVVVENDIAWRIHTMIDFMLGGSIRLVSGAEDPALKSRIELALDSAWQGSSGLAFLHDVLLLGHVYGHVDLLLRLDEPGLLLAGAAEEVPERDLPRAAAHMRVEVIEPTRAIPLLDESDYRRLRAYAIHFTRTLNRLEPGATRRDRARRQTSTYTEVLAPGRRVVYHDGALIEHEQSSLLPSTLPVVHIQNVSQPFRYEGLGEVEPLIPLQDELNTRLSDRANRVTLQSFKMYLAKGLDAMARVPVGPGQVWLTDNPDASIEAFGGDASSPSEEAHILEIREAMDKVSGVPPLASGVVRAKIGNLTSANALRITLMGLLSRTQRKRLAYGRAIEAVSAMMLEALDRAGILKTDPADRTLTIEWPDPIPQDPREQAAAALAKRELGIPDATLRAELGYAPASSTLD